MPRTTDRAPRAPRRVLDGVLLLDKPLGLSSNDALTRAKNLLRALKAGHTGTLDPLATGLLPLCFGEATKFSQDLLEATKIYDATLRLGITTTTGDAEGEVLEQRPVAVDTQQIHHVLSRFRSDIMQVPPMHSALKRDGKPLYAYARAGEVVERQPRAVTIGSLDWRQDAASLPDLAISVSCSKGTYIRVLAEDIGAALGCGAHLVALRRTGVGRLRIADSVSLDQLEALDEAARTGSLMPVDALLSDFPALHLDAESVRRFLQGQRLRLPDEVQFETAAHVEPASSGRNGAPSDDAAGPRIRVYDAASARLLGTARWSLGVLSPERLVASGESISS